MRTGMLLLLLGLSGSAMADGKQLLESRCMECHVVDGEGGEKAAAPPMYAVWHHYRQEYPERDAFVAAVSRWLQQPSRETSVMKGAVQKFGVMEQLEISAQDAQSVAAHIYQRDFEMPGWYLLHYKKSHGTKEHGYDGVASRQPPLPE